jgi:hypothetical protein
MELSNYYNLDECIDRKAVMDVLKSLKNEGKIEYSLDREILDIEDIDLDESEIEDLLDLFDKNDVFEELEYGDEWSDDDEWSDGDDEW